MCGHCFWDEKKMIQKNWTALKEDMKDWFITLNLCPWACLHTDFKPYAPNKLCSVKVSV